MMLDRRTVLVSAASAMVAPASAQVSAGQLFHGEGRYLPFWLELRDTDHPLASQFASFVGDETRALTQAARDFDQALTDGAAARPALETLVSTAASYRVVMLNEAHVASRHRSFLAQVLRALRPIGFTHFAAETFLHTLEPGAPDIRAFAPGRAFNPAYGFYTHDPVFAEAVREAAELGYQFVPYEGRDDQRSEEDATGEQRIARREEAQADNFISNALHPNSEGRFLIYVGLSHLRERPDPRGNEWFARRLRAKTGLDPLTIEQSFTGSFGPHAPDSALTRSVLERFSPDDSIVVDQDGAYLGANAMGADIAVFHPARDDVRGRPGWLAADPARLFVTVPLAGKAPPPPFLLQAVHAHEATHAVPADQVLIERDTDEAHLLLRPGDYRLRFETLDGFENLHAVQVRRA